MTGSRTQLPDFPHLNLYRPMHSFLRSASPGVFLLVFLLLLGCDSGGVSSTATDCDSRTGNSMSATVDGNAICTDLGSALLSGATGTFRLSVVGLFEDGASSISFNLDDPIVGAFDLSQTNAEHDAMYGTAAETGYYADRVEGSGTVTITDLSDERVKGTFEFAGIGYDINGDPTGTQARITDGAFDFAIDDVGFDF